MYFIFVKRYLKRSESKAKKSKFEIVDLKICVSASKTFLYV